MVKKKGTGKKKADEPPGGVPKEPEVAVGMPAGAAGGLSGAGGAASRPETGDRAGVVATPAKLEAAKPAATGGDAPAKVAAFQPRAPKKDRRAKTQGPSGTEAASGLPPQEPLPSEGPSRPMATTVKTQPLEQTSSPAQALLKDMEDMTIAGDRKAAMTASAGGIQIPRRKSQSSCGTLGRKMIIDTNHLPLDLSRLCKTVLHYDVHIDPDKPKRLIRPVMRQLHRQFFPDRNPVFDGKKNLYASKELPIDTSRAYDIKVHDAERERDKEFKVTLKRVNMLDMSALTAGKMHLVSQISLQALDIILRNAPYNSMVSVGRSFFSAPEGRVLELGDGMEAWIGFFQSAVIGWKPFVNIDVAHKGFPKAQSCDRAITDLLGRPPAPNQELNSFEKDDFMRYIRELKVEYVIPGQPQSKRTYRVNGIGKCPRLQEFQLDDGKRTTVEEYYARVKKYRVQFPYLPCLDVGSPLREKKILVPCELCTLVGGQVVIKKMTEKQTSALIKIAATDTDDRKRKIMAALKKCNFNNDPAIKEFGLRVDDKFQRVEARVLEPPKLQYKAQTQLVTPFKGVWRNNQFYDGKPLNKWTILSMEKYVKDDSLRAFASQLLGQARQVGMVIDPPQEPINTKIMSNETAKLQDFLNRNKHLQVVFVVVQDSGNSYAKVKQMAELTVGVLTQCLKNRTLNRMNPATVGNILLKVNAKLNGINHTFGAPSRPECLARPCMIVGADVTHPPPDQTSMPSVAAVCASHEPKAFKYNLQYRLQPPRMEIIQDLENIMKQQLMFFYHQNRGFKPLKIIFYRDGVSEGQFQEVLNVEFQAIRRACKSISGDDPTYEPKITFLVVQKRHHTRFFPTSTKPEDCDGRNKNVPAGTIVDTVITHPTDMDFYLVSHASIQGVSRPTKYRRLWDDSNMSEDELELLTYYLCHMFTRCTRSVSYPAPTYYAHLAAYRARCYLDGKKITMSNLPHEQDLRKIKDEIISGNPMFFV